MGRQEGEQEGVRTGLMPTLEQAHAFGMFMLKAVISGRGDELIDLAKANRFR